MHIVGEDAREQVVTIDSVNEGLLTADAGGPGVRRIKLSIVGRVIG
jgi:hypothetical protein